MNFQISPARVHAEGRTHVRTQKYEISLRVTNSTTQVFINQVEHKHFKLLSKDL